jgi:Family of unknown function (DUF6101)
VSSSSKPRYSLRIEACDPRSDNRRRVVDVAREAIVIRRAVAGVRMAIRVVSSAYRGVALRITELEEGRFHYAVELLHRDPDLSVPLADGEDRAAVEARWREWVGFLGLPAFVGRTASADVQVNIDGVELARRVPSDRRRGRGAMARRPRFLRRRKVGRSIRPAGGCSDPRDLAE